MAISEFEIKRIEKLVGNFVESRRPDPSIRNEVDISFKITGQNFEIFEIRQKWDDPDIKFEIPVAKTTYVKNTKIWKLYWKKSNMKWHRYKPFGDSKYLEEVLKVIDQDE